MGQFVQHGEEGCFAATFVGRFDAEVSGGVAQVEGVSVKNPEGECFGGVRWKDDETADEGGEVVQ